MEEMHIAKEQQCPNCGSVVDANFCKNCGQRVIEHKQTIGHVLLHFVSDILHYDGRFIKTLRLLLTRPGDLSIEYIKGVRQKYVDPFRLYLFISAFAFIVFFNFEKHNETITKIGQPEITRFIDSVRIALHNDTAFRRILNKQKYAFRKTEFKGNKVQIFDVADILRHGEHYYDSAQNTLSPHKRSKGYTLYREKKLVKAYEIFDTAPYNFFMKTSERISLIIPKSFLISMPFFIFTLLALYYNKRKECPSAYHAIFTLHFYSTVWIFITLDTIVSRFLEYPETKAIYNCIASTIYLGLVLYLFVAMLRFYKGRWWLTLIKTIILTIVTAFIYIRIAYALKEYHILSLSSLSA